MNTDLIFTTLIFIIIAVLVVALIILIKNNRLNVIRETCYTLFIRAEETYGAKQGKAKLQYVCDMLYAMFPTWLKLFIDEQTLKNLVQKWFDEITNLAKDYLDNGIIDNSTKED